MITKVKYVGASDIASLTTFVNEWIKKGWQPMGSVSIDSDSVTFLRYFQTMVKTDENDQEEYIPLPSIQVRLRPVTITPLECDMGR